MDGLRGGADPLDAPRVAKRDVDAGPDEDLGAGPILQLFVNTMDPLLLGVSVSVVAPVPGSVAMLHV